MARCLSKPRTGLCIVGSDRFATGMRAKVLALHVMAFSKRISRFCHQLLFVCLLVYFFRRQFVLLSYEFH